MVRLALAERAANFENFKYEFQIISRSDAFFKAEVLSLP